VGILHCAAEGGSEEVVKFLLDQGGEADIDCDGKTPLHYAVFEGHVGVVELLLQHMGTQALEERDKRGRTAVHYAVVGKKEEVLALLLSNGAQAGVADDLRTTPFMKACEMGQVGVARLLLQHQGEQVLEETNSQGRGAVHYAVQEGHEELLHFLLSQGAPANNREDSDGRTPLMVGAEVGEVGAVKMLLQHLGSKVLEETDERGQTALHLAAKNGMEEVVGFLLSQGADVHSKDKDGKTVLMSACWRDLSTVKLLLKHMGGRGLDEVNNRGDGVLHFAIRNQCDGVTRALLLAGAGQGVDLRGFLQNSYGHFRWWGEVLEVSTQETLWASAWDRHQSYSLSCSIQGLL
jgi:ankyrin repeat protein